LAFVLPFLPVRFTSVHEEVRGARECPVMCWVVGLQTAHVKLLISSMIGGLRKCRLGGLAFPYEALRSDACSRYCFVFEGRGGNLNSV
jgi:hypothetical protein